MWRSAPWTAIVPATLSERPLSASLERPHDRQHEGQRRDPPGDGSAQPGTLSADQPTRTPLATLERIRKHFFLFVVLLIALGIFLHEYSRNFFAYSSDAYVYSDFINIAPFVSGILRELHVTNNQSVKKGDVLFVIDLEPYRYRVNLETAALQLAKAEQKSAKDQIAEAQAQIAAAEASLADAEATQGRVQDLTGKGFATEQRLDDINETLRTARANLQSARAASLVSQDNLERANAQIDIATAQLALAQYNLAQATVTAPQSGHVVPFDARIGDYIDVGQEVLAIVTDDNWRVVVNLPEQHLGHLEVGQTTWLMLSSHPWQFFEGTVRSFSRGVARTESANSALPYVEPKTEWIRLSRRFPVEIDLGNLPEEQPLFLGADARVLILH